MIKRPWLTLFLAVFLLATNLFWIGPWISAHAGIGVANALYLGLRFVVYFGVSFLLAKFHRANRFQSLSLTAFVAFMDQVTFKSLWILREAAAHPAEWGTPSTSGVWVGLTMSYMMFLPIVLIVAFLGGELSGALARTSGMPLAPKS